jgi:hypothetical protein
MEGEVQNSTAVAAPAAATPAAPAPSAPAAAAAPAPAAATPEAQPQGDGFGQPVQQPESNAKGPLPGESNIEYLTRVQMEKINAAKAGGEPEPAKKEEGTAEDLPQTEGGETKEGEQPKPGEETPAEEKKDDKPQEQPSDDDAISLTPFDPVPTSKLAEAITKNPNILAELEKAGVSKDSLFATARLAAKGQKVLGFFNNDVETAEHAAKEAETFGTFTKAFTELQTPEDARALMQEMIKLDYVLDDDGNPLVGENGQPMTTGAMGRFMDSTFQLGIDYWSKVADETNNVDLKSAMEIIKGVYESRSGSASAKDYSNLDEETRQRLEEADRRDTEHANRQAAEQTQKEQQFEVNVAKGIESRLDTEIENLLKPASLTPGQLKWATNEIKERVSGKLKNSTMFFNKLDGLMRRRMSDKTMQQRVTHGINSSRPLLPSVARTVLDELGVQIGGQKQAAEAKLATQTQASRSEVKASQVAKPNATPTPAELNRMATDEWKAANPGREPKTSDIFVALHGVKKRLGLV